jgi:hypothetical protein
MSLTASYLRPAGAGRAIYKVNGPTKELEAYKAFQGSYGVDKYDANNVIIFADAPINTSRSIVYNVSFADELQRYFVDFMHLKEANNSVATANKRLNSALASAVTNMKAAELIGSSANSIVVQTQNAPEAAEAASESSDFDKEIEG